MATKKDLVEAYSFSRRRLVTAFVSGAPGGREVEPARPGRTIVGGLAIGVLLLAGAAILGVFKPHASVDWAQPQLLSDSHGGLYVNLGGSGDETTLHPVINATSAQLILGAGVEPLKIPDDKLNRHGRGAPLGILDAPATVPGADQLIQSGWSACTGAHHGVRVAVLAPSAAGPHTTAYAGAFLVHDADGYHVIATNEQGRAYAYALDNPSGQLTSGLHLPDAVEVSVRWTALFPRGEALDRSGLRIEGFGRPARGPSVPPGARYGDYFLSNGVAEVVVRGGFSPASPFARLVLEANKARELPAPTGQWSASGSIGSSSWPAQLPPGSAVPPSQLCAVLHDNGDGTTSIRTAVEPQGDASAVEVAAGVVDPYVSPGYGAVVRSASKDPATDPAASAGPVDTSGTTYLVDDRAYRYRIATPTDVTNLGYADLPAVVVPPQWIGLFRSGVELSRDAALCPPAAAEGAKACS